MKKGDLKSWKLRSALHPHMTIEVVRQPEIIIVISMHDNKIALTMSEGFELVRGMLQPALRLCRTLAGPNYQWRKMRLLYKRGEVETVEVERQYANLDFSRVKVDDPID